MSRVIPLMLAWFIAGTVYPSAIAAEVISSEVAQPSPGTLFETQPGLTLEPSKDKNPERNWSVMVGVAMIGKSDIGEVLTAGFEPAEGDARGQLYLIMLNWVGHRFNIPCRGWTLRPQFEPYACFTLVDEKGSSLFPDYNAGVGFRWVDFPWNRWVKTTFFMGVGLSYSSQVLRTDRERHPGEDRSHLKIDWPIQLGFAVPRWPQHQLVLLNDHQSGGHIFDRGGVNSVGIGYRYDF